MQVLSGAPRIDQSEASVPGFDQSEAALMLVITESPMPVTGSDTVTMEGTWSVVSPRPGHGVSVVTAHY